MSCNETYTTVLGQAAQAVFRPECLLPPEERHTVTELYNLPWLFFLILAELAASVVMNKQVYNLRQTLSNLSTIGFHHLAARLGMRALMAVPYKYIYENYRVVEWDSKHAWWIHTLAVLFCDFATYVVHWAMHQTNLGWAAHSVHHSSPDFNYSVGVRGGAVDIPFFGWITFLPLALVCPTHVYLAHRTWHWIYSVFVHTSLVGKLWWPIELVMNTPSHHRVHHSRNYGRKNFGDVLIVWDRLFGTFQEEREDKPPVFGLNEQPVVQGTYNSGWHQVHVLLATLRLAASGKVSPAKALFTRVTGPGMVGSFKSVSSSPADRSSSSEKDAPKQAAATKGGLHLSADATGMPAKKDAAGAAAAAGPRARHKFDAAYPWEKRPLTLLDVYAALQLVFFFFPVIITGMHTAQGLSIPQTVCGALFVAWTAACVPWVCGAQASAVVYELARLAAQAGIAAHALATASPLFLPLPLPGGAPAVLGLSAASALFLLAGAQTAGVWKAKAA